MNSGGRGGDSDGDPHIVHGIGGPGATARARVEALRRATLARGVVLVEGISDQVAVETVAQRTGRALAADRIVIVPVGGAHGMARYLERFGPGGAAVPVGGLCDVAEEGLVRSAVADSGLGEPTSRRDLEGLGFFVCVDDLEDELIRAVGTADIESIMETAGDLGSFRTLQRQPEWRGRSDTAQMRRFFSAGARRKLRYARLLMERVEPDRIPRPLIGVLDCVYGRSASSSAGA